MTDSFSDDKNPAPNTPAPRKSRWRRCGCFVLLLLAVLATAGVIILRLVLRSEITPEQQAAIERVENQFVSLPAEWHQPATLPPANVVSFHESFERKVSEIMDSHRQLLMGWDTNDDSTTKSLFDRLGYDLPPLDLDQQTSYALLLRDLEPLIEETSRSVALPGYTMETDLYQSSAFLAAQTFAKLTRVKAAVDAGNGKCLEAMQIAALPLRLAKRPPQSGAVTHLLAGAIVTISSAGIYDVATLCTDTLALRRGLELMNELRNDVFPGDISHWRYGDSLGALRFAAANGFPVDLKPQPLVDLYAQTGPLINGYYYQWLIDNLPPSDPRVKTAQARLYDLKHPVDYENFDFGMNGGSPEPERLPEVEIDATGTTSIPQWQLKLAKLVMGVNPLSLLYAIGHINNDENESRHLVSLALYDLTRLRLARRIAELESNPASTGDKVSEEHLKAYLGTVPLDPFTSSSYTFSQPIGYYSVGPDRTDNGAALLYNATNRTVSPGDLWTGEKR